MTSSRNYKLASQSLTHVTLYHYNCKLASQQYVILKLNLHDKSGTNMTEAGLWLDL